VNTKLRLSMLAAAALLSLDAGASAQQQAPNMTFFVTSAGRESGPAPARP
jgi:hypothetical protein